MSSQAIVFGIVAAVLLFWAVGAYNRLVSLRNKLLRCFATVDEQILARHALLLHWAEALQDAEPQALEALRAACQQGESACAHARSRPASAGALTSLRLAEEILAQTRERLQALPGADTPGAALIDSDTTLSYARRQFNDAAQAYNLAVSQFPTWVIAGLFRFRKTSTL